MGNIIKLEYNNKEYLLEFNRRTIVAMEVEGLIGKNSEELQKKNPIEFLYKFIGYAFRKNHPELSQKEIDEIIDNIGDLQAFATEIGKILQASISTVEGNQGNAKWERV